MSDGVILRIAIYGAIVGVFGIVGHAQAPVGCTVVGTVAAGRTTLPGVVLSLARSDRAASELVDVTSTAVDGSFLLRVPDAGPYTLKAELIGFAAASRSLNGDSANGSRSIHVLTSIAFFRGRVRAFETPAVQTVEVNDPDRSTAVFQFDVPAASLTPGIYTCQVNVIDDVAGTFAFPRLHLLVRR